VAVDADDSGVDARSAGWVLLAVGLAGLAPATMVWLSGGLGGRRRVD
jgi:hypothetical protein